jgi:hypothetical protein
VNRRRWLWFLAAACLIVGGEQFVLDSKLQDRGHGIIEFELAGSREKADEILADWGPEGRDTARLSLATDYVYLAVYGAFGVLLMSAAADRAGRRGHPRLARAGRTARWLPASAAAFDAVENAALLVTFDSGDGTPWPVLAAGFATLKFAALGLALVFALAAALAPERQ